MNSVYNTVFLHRITYISSFFKIINRFVFLRAFLVLYEKEAKVKSSIAKLPEWLQKRKCNITDFKQDQKAEKKDR